MLEPWLIRNGLLIRAQWLLPQQKNLLKHLIHCWVSVKNIDHCHFVSSPAQLLLLLILLLLPPSLVLLSNNGDFVFSVQGICYLQYTLFIQLLLSTCVLIAEVKASLRHQDHPLQYMFDMFMDATHNKGHTYSTQPIVWLWISTGWTHSQLQKMAPLLANKAGV